MTIPPDPTGYSCLLLMRWDVDTLRLGLADESPIFFVLTNTRALTPEQATEVTREVCRNLKTAIAESGVEDFLVVSHSDALIGVTGGASAMLEPIMVGSNVKLMALNGLTAEALRKRAIELVY